jgi:[ribosomal protein S18]-alanine N-acetyltransferase
MSGLPLKIRCPKSEDLEDLFEIDRICFPAGIAFSQAELLFHLIHPKSIAWLAEDTGRVLGFVLARLEGKRRAHIITLDVIPEARRRNLATTLMDMLHRALMARGVRVACLEVAVSNIGAQRLYERLQYRYMGTLAGYYRGIEDAYQMARWLNAAGV